MREKVIFNWSGGKDSALCLYKIQQEKKYEIIGLLTTLSEEHQRISMHGVRNELLDAQQKSIGMPLHKIPMPNSPSMGAYEQAMHDAFSMFKSKGVTSSVFGDIFLEDLRKYREEKLATVEIKGVFPLWNIPTDILIREFISLGFKTIITCVNEKYLDKSFAGRIIDDDFLNDLPKNVDPCGENGEFHTFVFDGPVFSSPILFEKGDIVYRKYATDDETNKNDLNNTGFWYCDLLPL